MKKIYLAALTLAMTACVSNEDLNPVDNYGYIDVNVSNDPIVETRTTPTSVNINNKNWFVTIGQTEYTGSNQAFTAGEYSIIVKTHTDVTTANEKGNWGEAYYDNQGKNPADKVTVVAGTTVTPEINCGKAKNARISVQFTEQFTNVFKTYKFKITAPRELTFDNQNKYISENSSDNKYAYFNGDQALTVTLLYDKAENVENPSLSISPQISLGAAGTEKIISVTANTHGNIQLNITTEGFGTPTTETLTFDAATGNKVQ